MRGRERRRFRSVKRHGIELRQTLMRDLQIWRRATIDTMDFKERVTRHADTVAPMFQYVIHWQDSDKAPEAVLADRYEDEGDEYVFYTRLEDGEEQRTAIPMGEVEIITLEGQEGV